MNWWEITLVWLYLAVVVVLAGYGLHRGKLAIQRHLHRRDPVRPRGHLSELPVVTVQLPLYNERYVVERLIDAVCALDWPRDRLEIQVLDDSTDDTRALAAAAVARWRAQGVDIHHLRRPDRTGYKPGALQWGLERARGEFIAIFDADFVPPPDFLRRTVDFFTDPKVGLVQTRWGHLNREHSPLTQVQALLLDGHFLVEHFARHRAGLFFNFNGTAGIWRRAAIVDSGGWEADTLTEDIDLSYRAQLRGWRFVFLPEVESPAELPVEMNAFKVQQHRWTKGSIQTCVKMLPAVLRARLPFAVKFEAFVHLTANLSHPLMALLALLLGPVLLIRTTHHLTWLTLVDTPLFVLSTVSVAAFYLIAQRQLGPGWLRRTLALPLMMAVAIGLSVSNSKGVVEALLGRRSPFVRTPKHRIECRGQRWVHLGYRAQSSALPLVELLFGAWFVLFQIEACQRGLWLAVPGLVLFPLGFFSVGLLSLGQRWALRLREVRLSNSQ